MGKIVKMTATEIDNELTPEKISLMLKKAKRYPIGKNDNPYSPEEWWAKAERPNRGRPPKETVKKDIHIRLDPFTLKKLKSLGRGWQTRLSAKVDEWVRMDLL
ncbi:MAG: BrnA antitoxin family protein [Treponema sp.]|nr:BrnA antitoxin family protein [Treponema sp.]